MKWIRLTVAAAGPPCRCRPQAGPTPARATGAHQSRAGLYRTDIARPKAGEVRGFLYDPKSGKVQFALEDPRNNLAMMVREADAMAAALEKEPDDY